MPVGDAPERMHRTAASSTAACAPDRHIGLLRGRHPWRGIDGDASGLDATERRSSTDDPPPLRREGTPGMVPPRPRPDDRTMIVRPRPRGVAARAAASAAAFCFGTAALVWFAMGDVSE